VILQTRTVATGGFGKVMSASCWLLGVAALAVLFGHAALVRALPAQIDFHSRDRRSPPITGRLRIVISATSRQPACRRLTPTSHRGFPLATVTIGRTGIILRSSAACSVTGYLPRAGHLHALRAIDDLPARALEYAWEDTESTRTRTDAGSNCRGECVRIGRQGHCRRGGRYS